MNFYLDKKKMGHFLRDKDWVNFARSLLYECGIMYKAAIIELLKG